MSTLSGSKAPSRSLGVWGGAVAALAGLGGLVGWSVSPDQAAELGAQADQVAAGVMEVVQAVASLAAMVGGLLAVWGRVRATTAIGAAPPPGDGRDG